MAKKLKKNETFEYQKLSQEEMTKRGILGRLVGPCADFINPTRNGRKYGEDLWEKVFNDPIMQEKIKNGVCLGELGHPADRTETDIAKVAVSMKEVPVKNDKGQLIATFDILDTPNGRILKTLCDYGSIVGISSRGTGDVIKDDMGEDIVDPSTYDCECWDVVLVPAVETARLQYVTESVNNRALNLTKALTEELKSANKDERKVMEATLQELNIEVPAIEEAASEAPVDTTKYKDILNNQIDWTDQDAEKAKEQLRSLNTEKVITDDDYNYIINHWDELLESIPETGGDIHMTEQSVKSDETQEVKEPEEAINNGTDELVNNLQEALKAKSNLEVQVKELQEKLAVNDIKVNEVNEELAKYKKGFTRLSTIVSEKKKLEEKVSTLEKTLEELKAKNAELEREADSGIEIAKTITESVSVKEKAVAKLNEDLVKQKTMHEKEIVKLTESMKALQKASKAKEAEGNEKIARLEKLKESYKKLAAQTMSHYIESKADMLGITVEEIRNRLPESYTIETVNQICESLQQYELNIRKLPFNVDRKVKVRVRESLNEPLRVNKEIDDDVDDSLMRIANLKK